MQKAYLNFSEISQWIMGQKNIMKRNEKHQKPTKNKGYRSNHIVSAFVHQEEIFNNCLISNSKMSLRFFAFSPDLISTKKKHSMQSGS